jgi:carbon-monoxide dehydrogenase small subunit
MQITVKVNGADRSADVEPRLLLAHLIREEFGLTGTHVG